eukprot:UN18837
MEIFKSKLRSMYHFLRIDRTMFCLLVRGKTMNTFKYAKRT